MIKNKRTAFTSTIGKEDYLPATAIRERTTIVSLIEETIHEPDTSKDDHQGEHSELSRNLRTLSLVFPPIKSHLEVQNK
jgi:hypothetical protein